MSVVTAMYHPLHLGSAVGYEVPVPELSKLNAWLYEHRLSVILQVHTHPGAAFHSSTDDRWPTIETTWPLGRFEYAGTLADQLIEVAPCTESS